MGNTHSSGATDFDGGYNEREKKLFPPPHRLMKRTAVSPWIADSPSKMLARMVRCH
jgi:hypothetical protein